MNQTIDAMQILAKIPLFAGLSKQSRWRLAELMQVKKYKTGEVIIQEGGTQTGCFIILKGKVEIIKDLTSGTAQKITELGEGEIMGEMNIIDGEPHSASARTLTDSECLMISYWDFKAQMQAYPEIALQLLPVLVKRLRGAE